MHAEEQKHHSENPFGPVGDDECIIRVVQQPPSRIVDGKPEASYLKTDEVCRNEHVPGGASCYRACKSDVLAFKAWAENLIAKKVDGKPGKDYLGIVRIKARHVREIIHAKSGKRGILLLADGEPGDFTHCSLRWNDYDIKPCEKSLCRHLRNVMEVSGKFINKPLEELTEADLHSC